MHAERYMDVLAGFTDAVAICLRIRSVAACLLTRVVNVVTARAPRRSSLIFFVPTLAFKFLVFPGCWIVGRPLTKWRRY